MTEQPRICDYEGSDYRTDFWEGQARDYEDQVERAVLRRLLPGQGRRLLEIGAGFGRLTNEYHMYERVVLLDYSFSQLQYAREQYGDDGFTYVAADAYHLPFVPGVFDGATMIRVLHHFERVEAVLAGIRRVMAPAGTFILEFANKRNLKAMARHHLGQQGWNPYTREQIEFVELNFNFHPETIANELQVAGFEIDKRVPVSFLRVAALKQMIPAGALVRFDGILQRSGALISPSIFTRSSARRIDHATQDATAVADVAIFADPQTGVSLYRDDERLVDGDGVARFAIREGIYDFKQRLD